MPVDGNGFDALLGEWQALPAGDRKAILRRLPHDQRLMFQRLTAAIQKDGAAAANRSRPYRAYSVWLARIIEGCETASPDVARTKPAVRAALLEAHESLNQESQTESIVQTLADTVHLFVRRWRELL